jgi:hypothetical protein
MDWNVICWPLELNMNPTSLRTRLEGVLAIFAELHDGELLAALPECEDARTQQQMAITLLALAERELADMLRICTGIGVDPYQ